MTHLRHVKERRLRGFTMLELMTALIISAIVATVATTAVVQLMKTIKMTDRRSRTNPEARRIVDYSISRLQAVGGGPVRTWMAVWVEDANDGTNTADCEARGDLAKCDKADRVTVVELYDKPYYNDCPVISSTNTKITSKADTEVIWDPGNPAYCCYDLWSNNALDVGQFNPGAAMLLVNGDFYEVLNIFNRQDACNIERASFAGPATANGQAYGINNKPAAANDYANGMLYSIRVFTLYVDETKHQLFEWEDKNINGNMDLGETYLIAPNVWDLQFALAYDSNPEDGVITETGGVDDEWLGNAAGDAIGVDGLVNAQPKHLRMADVGVVSAAKVADGGGNSASVLNGFSISNAKYFVRAVRGRAMFRNTYLFY